MGACQSSSGNVTAVEQTTQSVDDAVDVNSHVSVKVSQTNINDYRDISQLDVCQSKSEASIGVNQNENEMVESCHIFCFCLYLRLCACTDFSD